MRMCSLHPEKPVTQQKSSIAKHINTKLWMRDLVLQFNYILTCQSCLGMSIIITRKEKSLKTKRDVGMAWQKMTQTREDIKVKVNIQSLIHPYILLHYSCTLVWERCRDGAWYIYLHFYILRCLCHLFSSLVYLLVWWCYLISLIFSDVNTISSKWNHNPITWKSTHS